MTTIYKDLEGNTHIIQTVKRPFGTFAVFNNKSDEQESLGNHKEEDYHNCIRELINEGGGKVL